MEQTERGMVEDTHRFFWTLSQWLLFSCYRCIYKVVGSKRDEKYNDGQHHF
jgi:hypothetical protein